VRDVGTEREVECFIFWGTDPVLGTGQLELPISELDTLACNGPRMKVIEGGEVDPLEVIFYVTARDSDVADVPGFVLNGSTFNASTFVDAPFQSVLSEQLGAPVAGLTWILKFAVPAVAAPS
jgi:hypothetical protein